MEKHADDSCQVYYFKHIDTRDGPDYPKPGTQTFST